MQLPVSHSNFWPFSRYWRILVENSLFPHRTFVWRPIARNALSYQRNLLKNIFNGLQCRRWQYGSIFIRLAAVRLLAPKSAKSRKNSEIIRSYSTSRPSIVIGLGVNWKRTCICDFLLVNNSNFGRISYRFRDIDVWVGSVIFLDETYPKKLGGWGYRTVTISWS